MRVTIAGDENVWLVSHVSARVRTRTRKREIVVAVVIENPKVWVAKGSAAFVSGLHDSARHRDIVIDDITPVDIHTRLTLKD